MPGQHPTNRPGSPTRPYSSSAKSVIVNSLDDATYYAFNYSSPNGVKLLARPAANRLIEIISGEASVDPTNALDRSLITSGLAVGQCCDGPIRRIDKRRISVWLHIVNGCNFACSYCYIPHLRKAIAPAVLRQHVLDSQDYSIIAAKLTEFAEANEAEELHITFAGGEPTLDPAGIDEFAGNITRRSKMPVTFGMISNGAFDCDVVIPILMRHSISLSVSIDGMQERHDANRFQVQRRSRVGTWQRIWSNIEKVQSDGINPYLLITITDKNYRDIEALSDHAHTLGLGYRLSLVRNEVPYGSDVVCEITNTLISHYKRLGDSLSSDLPIARYAKFAEWDLSKKKFLACSTCRTYFAIDHNASVSSCQMGMSAPLGNLRKDSFADIIDRIGQQPALKILMNPQGRTGACTTCQLFHVCAGGCPQHTIKSNGDVESPSIWCATYGALVPVYVEAVAKQMHRKLHTLRKASTI